MDKAITRDTFAELAEKAIKYNATREEVDALVDWCEQYGASLWNGEEYDISLPGEPAGTRKLRPIYDVGGEEDDMELIGWEIWP